MKLHTHICHDAPCLSVLLAPFLEKRKATWGCSQFVLALLSYYNLFHSSRYDVCFNQKLWDGWMWWRCCVSYITGVSNRYWLTVGQGLLSLYQVRVEGNVFISSVSSFHSCSLSLYFISSTTSLPAQWLSGRASALWPGGCGFDPRPGHTKDFKNGTSCSFAWRSALRK